MKTYVVFCTYAGDIFATEASRFWRYFHKHRENVAKLVKVNAFSPKGALIAEPAYSVINAAWTHRNLSLRGY